MRASSKATAPAGSADLPAALPRLRAGEAGRYSGPQSQPSSGFDEITRNPMGTPVGFCFCLMQPLGTWDCPQTKSPGGARSRRTCAGVLSFSGTRPMPACVAARGCRPPALAGANTCVQPRPASQRPMDSRAARHIMPPTHLLDSGALAGGTLARGQALTIAAAPGL